MGEMDDGFTVRRDAPVVFQHDLKQPCNCKGCLLQLKLDAEAHIKRLANGTTEPITLMPSKEDIEATRQTLDLTMAADQVNHTIHDPLDRPYVDDHAGEAPDVVNHPPHYKRGGLECIDVIEGFGLGFRLGNAVKYILRAGHKGDRLEDLRKARWYLDREIERG
jgi:hypothetical protein